MNTKAKVILTTVILAIPAFILGPQIWPPSAMGPTPTPAQLPFFIFLALMEAVTFGLGASFIFYGWKYVRKVSGKADGFTRATYVAISWSLISWWPHDNLHIHNGMDLQGLLFIEYGFHLTLMISAIVIAYFFLKHTHSAK